MDGHEPGFSVNAGYITVGDRVVVTEGVLEDEHMRKAKPELVGQHGVVEDEDGWGFCRVRLDDGSMASLWNEKDLAREEPA